MGDARILLRLLDQPAAVAGLGEALEQGAEVDHPVARRGEEPSSTASEKLTSRPRQAARA